MIHPTRSTVHVALAGAGLVTFGVGMRLAPAAAFGGAMLLAVAFGRAVAILSVARLRAAGFDMAWIEPARVKSVRAGGVVVLEGELRNRGAAPVRAANLQAIASGMLDAAIDPAAIDIPPGGRARVGVTLRPRRVGRWGVHGIALVARAAWLGGDTLYEKPLVFASPLGLEVLPPSLAAFLDSPRGGRARRASEAGSASNLAGDGGDLLELRDHAPGDPFKRIAWKASARRGRLLVRETARETRDVVWLVVDASVELWAGVPGSAPLDRVIDEVATMAARRLRRGERVGLAVTAARLRAWIAPAGGAAQGAAIARALAGASSAVDADRSELDEAMVARRVSEHARQLDPRGLEGLRGGDLDALARRADALRPSAPFAVAAPFARTPREQRLRHYMAAFGIESPPCAGGERDRAEEALAAVFERIAGEKARASVVHVWAPPPGRDAPTTKAVAAVRARRVRLRWTLPPFDAGVGSDRSRRSAVADAVDDAVRARAEAARWRGTRLLRRMGVEVVDPARPRRSARGRAADGAPRGGPP